MIFFSMLWMILARPDTSPYDPFLSESLKNDLQWYEIGFEDALRGDQEAQEKYLHNGFLAWSIADSFPRTPYGYMVGFELRISYLKNIKSIRFRTPFCRSLADLIVYHIENLPNLRVIPSGALYPGEKHPGLLSKDPKGFLESGSMTALLDSKDILASAAKGLEKNPQFMDKLKAQLLDPEKIPTADLTLVPAELEEKLAEIHAGIKALEDQKSLPTPP